MLRLSIAAALALASVVALAAPAQARPCAATDTNPCTSLSGSVRAPAPRAAVVRALPRRASYSATVIGGAPAGCRHLRGLYCGCASAIRAGISGARWNVNRAGEWLGLPRASPAPGMAATNWRHVKIIIGVVGNGVYRFYDPNSGGGLTRITTGPLAGYTVVNPHGAHRSMFSARKRGRR